MSFETCGVCGGDGRMSNSFGSETTCPGCHGSGRRSHDTGLMHDVTKTKPSHHRPANKVAAPDPNVPTTFEGAQLAGEVKAHGTISNDVKGKLTREIVEYEASHGRCTQTFIKKIRKQLR